MQGRGACGPRRYPPLLAALVACIAACSVEREAIAPFQPGAGPGPFISGQDGGAVGGGGDAAAADGSDAPADSGACIANPDPAGDAVCPWICPESCDAVDNDCDGQTDEEEASRDCALAHAAAECLQGQCVVASCDDWYDDCDDDASNGCETWLETLDDCGACGATCTSECGDPVCLQGVCTLAYCEPGFSDCDCDPANGCETSLNTLSDCGACGRRCGYADARASCDSGSCVFVACHPGFGDCDVDLSNGCETALDTVDDCGACDATCQLAHGSVSCATGSCALESCDRGYDDCDGDESNGCESALNTASDCGACDATCDLLNADESCATGACTLVDCEAGWEDCDTDQATGCETAIDTLLNCGACSETCDLLNADQSCASGSCTLVDCDGGWGDCDSDQSSGCETPLDTLVNCGACSETCDLLNADESCATGACLIVDCDIGYGDCNDTASDGCETLLMDVDDGLAGHWSLDEGSGLVAYDTSGLGNDGALVNMTGDEWTQGAMDGALRLDGLLEHVQVGDVGSGIRTFSFWVNSSYGGAASSGQSGWQDPSAFDGAGQWTGAGNVYASDNSRASMSGTPKSHWWSGFGLQVPQGSSVYGIEVRIEKSASASGSSLAVELSWDGGTSFTSTGSSVSFSNSSDNTVTLGGTTETWGRAWSAEEINQGLAVRLTGSVPGDSDSEFVYVDHIQVNVQYGTDSGAVSPGGFDDDSWTDPGNAGTSDDAYASMSGRPKSLDWSGFALGIPSGATIHGIEVGLEKRASNTSSNSSLGVELSWDGGTTYTTTGNSVSFSNGSDDVAIFGGPADGWGRNWSSAELDDASFRVRLRGSVPADSVANSLYLDQIRVTVSYTYSASTGLNGASGHGPTDEWFNPDNAYTSDNQYASMTGSNLYQDWSGFGLDVPSGATVDGLEVRVERSTDDPDNSSTIGVELSWNAGSSVTATGYSVSFTSGSDINSSFGGASNTWGRTWTDTEVNNANFRVRVRGNSSIGGSTILVDQVRAGASYTHTTDTGPHGPTDYERVGWVDAADAYSSDDNRASMSGTPSSQAWSGFDLQLPGNALYDGIEVTLEKSASYLLSGSTLGVELSWDGGNTYTHTGNTVSFQNASDNTVTFGGRTDTWGRSWSYDDFGSESFRVRLRGSVPGDSSSRYIYIDQIQVRVYYTTGLLGSGLKSPTATGSPNHQWTQPERAFSSDDGYATISGDNLSQDYAGFDLGVPDGVTVQGVEVRVEATYSGFIFPATLEAELSWNGGGSYTATGYSVSIPNNANAVFVLGGRSDTWGRSWSASDFSDGDFRVRLTASLGALGDAVSIDHVQAGVFYPDEGEQKIIGINGSSAIEVVDGEVTPVAFPGTTTVYLDGSPGTTLTTGWHHLAVTDTTGLNVSNLQLGRTATGYFGGLLDEVRLYDRALTPDEVAYLSGDDSCP